MAFEWQCPKCGREFNTTSGKCANWECNNADVYIPYVKTGKVQGWQCPICKAVYAPWVQSCECAKAEPVGNVTKDQMDKHLEDCHELLEEMVKE